MEQNGGSIFPVEDALEMVIMFDRTGKITYANDAAEKKLEYEQELCGRNISDIFPNHFTAAESGLETACPFGYELQNLVAYRKNLTCFPVEVRIMSSDAQPQTYICMAIDTLEKEHLNREVAQIKKEVQQAARVKSEFVANVTHELRTPVNGVLGNIRELLDVETEPDKLRPMRMIERCCEDMNKLIDNILDFSKLEAGKFTLEKRKFHVRDMLDYVKAHHISKITEKGLEFFMTVSPNVPEYVTGDELRIKQILNNLLSNALKFTSVGKITVEILKTAQINGRIELFFIVIDSGIGIDKAEQDKLFQSFSQVDASISRKYGGTGLGLNICKQLVELMGGRIAVESRKGRGSTFSFSIWVDSCEEEPDGTAGANDARRSALTVSEAGKQALDDLQSFGTPKNREALEKNLSKLILCVEMENWEKAEGFTETIRQLTSRAPREVGRMVLRLKMAIQKEDYEKTASGFEELKAYLQ